MVMLDTGKSGAALLLGPSGTRPNLFNLGSGSGTIAVTDTWLKADLDFPRIFTNVDISTSKETTWTGDWDALGLSGLTPSEFVLSTGSTIESGTAWVLEYFGSRTYDGSRELQIQITLQVY